MSKDLYTVVGEPLHGYACHGRKTYAEAVAEAKAHFEHTLAGAQAQLAAIEAGTIRVEVQRGRYAVTVLEVLTPP